MFLSKRRGRRSIIAVVKDEKLHLCSNKVWPTDRGVMKMQLHLCNFYIECRGGLLVQFILFFFLHNLQTFLHQNKFPE